MYALIFVHSVIAATINWVMQLPMALESLNDVTASPPIPIAAQATWRNHFSITLLCGQEVLSILLLLESPVLTTGATVLGDLLYYIAPGIDCGQVVLMNVLVL